MKYILSIILTFWVAFASAQTTDTNGAPVTPGKYETEGGAAPLLGVPCKDGTCGRHVDTCRNQPCIDHNTNPPPTGQRPSSGADQEGTDGPGRSGN